MFGRENAIGVVLLLLCAVVAGVLLYSIGTGTRFRFTGPGWVSTALMIFFIGATVGAFFLRPGTRRWPWDRWRNRGQSEDDRSRDL